MPEIHWRHDLEAAINEAKAQQKHVLLYFSAAPM